MGSEEVKWIETLTKKLKIAFAVRTYTFWKYY